MTWDEDITYKVNPGSLTGAGCFVTDDGKTVACFVRNGKIEIIDGFSADTDDADMPKILSDFRRLARNLESGNMELSLRSDHITEVFGTKPLVPAELADSNVITSRVGGYPAMHRVVIDLDMDAALIPSSTKGHHHLIINKDLLWEEYQFLLQALNYVGLIQKGYFKAALNRKATVLRTPWTKK